ncbi:hypothetical protein QR680_016884 [Steinernema hermaphroditum]|uniref:Uncharacterized protein n=1 Tax=Steinernema hermaphroditum TaxID=289476 RepID=A0AA39HEL0_9BILA|nr:hypothetical protein QR680_016884 [Steinernema hermaphroditum]
MKIMSTVPYVEYGEFLLNCIAPFVNVYFLFLLRRPFFHLNLRIILGSFSASLIVLTISRVVILLDSFSKCLPDSLNTAVNVVHNTCILGLMDASVLMAFERLIASLFVDKYENVRNWWIAGILCGLAWSFNGYFAYFLIMLVRTNDISKYRVPSMAIFVVILVMNCVGIVAFVLISRCNQRRWKTDLQKNLSQRYQIMENMRTSRQLLIALLTDFVISLYLFFVMFRLLTVEDASMNVLSQLFDICCALMAINMPCLFIRTHPRLLAVVKGHWKMACCSKGLSLTASSSRIVSVVPLQKKAREEGNIYFNQFEKSWGRAVVR